MSAEIYSTVNEEIPMTRKKDKVSNFYFQLRTDSQAKGEKG